MTKQRLDSLRREAPLDRPRGEEVPHRMDTVLCLAAGVYDPSLDLERVEAPVCDVRVALDLSHAVGKYQLERPLRAGDPPFLERVDDHRRHRDFAITGRRFRRTDLAPKICALPNVDHVALEIDIIPGQAAQF